MTTFVSNQTCHRLCVVAAWSACAGIPWGSGSSLLATPPTTLPDAPSPQRTDSEPVAEPPAPSIGLTLCSAISDVEIDRYKAILRLSPAQSIAVDSLWEKYLDQWKRADEAGLPAVIQLSQDAGRLHSQFGYQPQVIVEFERLDEAEFQLAQSHEQVDSELFSEIEKILTPDQLQRMARVRAHRERSMTRPLLFEVFAARIDISRLVETAGLSEESFDAVDPVLVEYEKVVTPLFTRLRKSNLERSQKTNRIISIMAFDEEGNPRDLDSPDQANRAKAATDEIERLQDRYAELQMQISAANRRFLPMVVSALPQQVGEDVTFRFRVAAYPKVYPDSLDPEPLYRALLDGESLDGRHRTIVEAIWTPYRQSYTSICQKMEDGSDKWQDHFVRTRNGNGFEEFRTQMRRFRDDRWLQSAQFVQQVLTLLPPEQLGQVGRGLREYRQRASLLEEIAQSDFYPGP